MSDSSLPGRGTPTDLVPAFDRDGESIQYEGPAIPGEEQTEARILRRIADDLSGFIGPSPMSIRRRNDAAALRVIAADFRTLRAQLQTALSERDEARTNEIAWSECIVMAQETLDALIFVKRLDRGQAAMFLPEAIRNACILSRDEALAHQEEEHRIALASARAEERQLLGMLKGCEQMLGEARAEGERLRTKNAKLWNCLSLTRDDVFIGWADPELIDPTLERINGMLSQMTTPKEIG